MMIKKLGLERWLHLSGTFTLVNREVSSTRKGYLGELEVHKDLLKKGWNIYVPVVDDHGIDLIAQKCIVTYRIQIKSQSFTEWQTRRSSVEVRVRRKSIANILAIPIYLHNCVCYVPVDFSGNMPAHGFFCSLAIKPAKNNQNKNRKWYKDYVDLPETISL